MVLAYRDTFFNYSIQHEKIPCIFDMNKYFYLFIFFLIPDATMSLTEEPTVFPFPDLNSQSIFTYNTTSSIPGDIASRLHSDDELLNKDHVANLTLFSAVNDTLLGDLSRTLDQAGSAQSVPVETIIGVCLALLANFLIGCSIILKKQSLKKLKVS